MLETGNSLTVALDLATRAHANKDAYVVMLIGPPGCGKTTFRRQLISALAPYIPVVISSDDLVHDFAQDHSVSYDEAFSRVGNQSVNLMKEKLAVCAKAGLSCIIDQTNPTRKSRLRKLEPFGADFIKVGVYFDVSEKVVLSRLAARGEHGANVHVYKQINNILQEPYPDEFDVLYKITT
jgi:adenylate kinase family enzyme